MLCIGPLIAIPRTAATTYEVGVLPSFPGAGPIWTSVPLPIGSTKSGRNAPEPAFHARTVGRKAKYGLDTLPIAKLPLTGPFPDKISLQSCPRNVLGIGPFGYQGRDQERSCCKNQFHYVSNWLCPEGHPRKTVANRAKAALIANTNEHQRAHWTDEPSKKATKPCRHPVPFCFTKKKAPG
jgi:hypothetical protein